MTDGTRLVGLEMTTGDGETLAADAWQPAGEGPWPVLLQRLPYGRSVASTPVLPHPAWFARRGYAVVVQDCRGRGGSTGTFAPFVAEARDGAEAIEWAARLPFSDGRVVTYGFSYQGLAQLYAAAERPPSLVGVAAMMCCPDPYEGWTYEGGCLRLPFAAFWAAQLAGQDDGRGPLPFEVHALPVAGALGTSPPPWFVEWLAHPDDDRYWAQRRPDLGAIDVPVFTVLGWFDDFSSGTARLVEALGAEAVCGPWAHMPWGTRHGDVELGEDAGPRVAHERLLAFLDGVVGRRPRVEAAAVAYWSGGAGWRTAPTWPPLVRIERWSTTSGGDANSRHGDGRLVPGDTDPGPGDVLVVEPLVPYPGGPIALQDESSAEDRRDVLCYTSDLLEHPLDIAGSPRVTVTVACDRTTHDVMVTLTVVSPDGTSRAITGGARRCRDTGPAREQVAELRPIAWRVAAGERIRLDVSGARFPAFDRNPHSPVAAADARPEDTVVATLAVASVLLELPVDDGHASSPSPASP